MKKLTFSLLITMLVIAYGSNTKANTTEWQELYKYLGKSIKYPIKATNANLQGNSLILFSVSNGKLKDLKVRYELGYDCDTEILNKILSFPSFHDAKDGNYALKTYFKLDGSNAELKNEEIIIPKGYSELKITIIGFIPKKNAATSSSYGGRVDKEENNTIKIRGAEGKISENVLIVLNGAIIENSTLNSINPNQIESLNILKDASATALYGEKGKNGVIIITTKNDLPALSGSVSGLSIQKSNGDKETTKILIRGEKNWGKEDPLIVIDGEISALDMISPDNIESITVLKDASSTTQYGEKGKNGIITITTKKGTTTISGETIKNDDKEEQKSGIIIRGKTLEHGQQPLYVVDGEIIEDISTVAPDNIKEIKVTKTANGISAYGDKGKNGVIEITTKNAKKETPTKTNDKQKF